MATLTHLSQNSGSLPDGQSLEHPALRHPHEDALSPGYSQPLHVRDPPNSLGRVWGQTLPLSRAICLGALMVCARVVAICCAEQQTPAWSPCLPWLSCVIADKGKACPRAPAQPSALRQDGWCRSQKGKWG